MTGIGGPVKPIGARSWTSDAWRCRQLWVNDTTPGDNTVEVMACGVADGITVLLDPGQCEEVAADLIARAALIRAAASREEATR